MRGRHLVAPPAEHRASANLCSHVSRAMPVSVLPWLQRHASLAEGLQLRASFHALPTCLATSPAGVPATTSASRASTMARRTREWACEALSSRACSGTRAG
jgi:hypothetical protein